jgi:hypothetical protein
MFALALLLVSGCHTDKSFTQTFESEKDPSQTLKLTSKTGFVEPNADFPRSIFSKVFASELDGKYEQTTAAGIVKGTFTAAKDGEKQWIRFKPGDGGAEWKVQVKLSGMLADGDKVWMPKEIQAEAKAAPMGITFGGN